jgi:hypothetical protein
VIRFHNDRITAAEFLFHQRRDMAKSVNEAIFTPSNHNTVKIIHRIVRLAKGSRIKIAYTKLNG